MSHLQDRLSSLKAHLLTPIAAAVTMSTSKIQDPNSLPWDPTNTTFPLLKDLPRLDNAPDEAAWFWGADDQLGRLNLLTPERVKRAAAEEIKSGEMVPLNLPLDVPEVPSFAREKFVHKLKTLVEGIAYDDTYHLNPQAGSQWDGFRHFAHIASATFYNGAKGTDFTGPTANTHKCSIHHWSEHGIASRGILLDYWSYKQARSTSNPTPYDPFSSQSIPYSELALCGESQGIDIRPEAAGGSIRPGDIILIRTGWKQTYDALSPEYRNDHALGLHNAPVPGSPDPNPAPSYAGVAQSREIITWLHDTYAAAAAGDSPTFEVWPSQSSEGWYVHEYMLARWGMPIGEMWDLEGLSEKCKKSGRWTFFLSSSVANVKGGVASHPNAIAIF